MRGPASSSVTRTPKRAITWVISAPIGPPPMTVRLPGRSVTCTTSRLVQYGVSASPSIGRRAGRVPGFSTTPREARKVLTLPSGAVTSTTPGPASRPVPCSTVAPASARRSTATWSSQWVVASSAMRRATGAQEAVTEVSPAVPSTRPASASRSAARTIIFDGMHP